MGFVTRVIKALLLSICALFVLALGINVLWSVSNPPVTMSSLAGSVDPVEKASVDGKRIADAFARAQDIGPASGRFKGHVVQSSFFNSNTRKLCGVIKAHSGVTQQFITGVSEGDPVMLSGTFNRQHPIDYAMYFDNHPSFKDDWDKLCRDAHRGSSPAHTSPWKTEESVSQFDDTRTVVLVQRVGTQRLVIQCKERDTHVYVDFGGPYVTTSEHNEWGLVTYRVDKQPAVTKRWYGSTNHRALFAREPIATVKEWATGGRLVVRTIPVNESAVTLEFDLTGLNEALGSVRKACGW